MAFRGAGRWSRWSGRQLRIAEAAACVVAAVLQTCLWAHGVSEGRGRGSAGAGSAAVGHSRLLAEGTKEEEKREEDVGVLGLGGQRGRGPRRRDNWLGKLRALNPAVCGNCCRHAGNARAGCRCPASGKAEWDGDGEVSVLVPRLLRSFPETFRIRCRLGRTWKCP